MRANKKIVAAGAAGLLGLGLATAVPALADPSPSPSASAKDHREHRRHPGMRAMHGLRGVHGEATVKRKDGFHVVGWQRGQITALSGGTLTVHSEDGTDWQWAANAQTRVRKDKAKADMSALAKGDKVVVFGENNGGTRTAKVVRVTQK
ncbi:DUF5666 domain-containing protein [Actinomadura macrotermitis]|uniref:DUF5666 domain-containing protein n=1 Tax=Actinomadura macrotermitis TaxID=2585200 RepID=A0A7K0BUW8_9ACTN|nr:DUF5666 domain-containing protein [Actinomadura macrotermitis]MQY05000.1 hypothetical protein [Actinomadura macrotermitis]